MTTFVGISYGEGSLGPLESFAYESGATTNQGIGSFQPLTSNGESWTPNGYVSVEASFQPLTAFGADGAFAQAITAFLPMESEASSGEITPSYAVASNHFNQLLGWAHGYTPAGYFYGCLQDPYLFSGAGAPLAANSFEYTLPFSFIAYGGATGSARMPKATLTASGTVPAVGRATLVMPLPTVLSTGMGGSYGRSAAALPTPYPVRGFSGAVLSVTLQDGYTILAHGISGAVGRATLTLPLYELVASAHGEAFGTAEVEMPMLVPTPSGVAILVSPRARLVAAGSAVVAVDYEAYVATVPDSSSQENKPEEPHTYAVTRYDNYPFNQIVRIGRQYFGVADDGLYLLEGTTDNGAPTAWAWRMCKTNFGSHNHKSVGSVYLGGRLDSGVKYKVIVGEDTEYSYTHVTPRDAQPQNYREFFGKGIKATYFAFELYDNAGRYMEVDNCEFEVAELKRAI